MDFKTVGRSGQISLGKDLAGTDFLVEKLADGDIILRRAKVVPLNEKWLDEPRVKERLARADAWLNENKPAETDLDALEADLAASKTKRKQ
ncbi:MAG: hypothetical protein JWP36_777 [Paucimonas sp.]|nr:hypothetical protein [Paucimonas sp.]